jgi:hypothetical protein
MNKQEALSVNENVDSEKRGRIIFFSLLLTLSMFIVKISQTWDQTWIPYLIATIYAFITFTGLIWVFSFQIRLKSVPCLIQSSLFVGSEFLFVEMFFFDKLDRIYEAFLLLGFLGVIWVATYISFLMSNIFNVGLYKDIPLEQAARTASYILSLFMVYFLTFSFLANGIVIYILLPVILVSYFSITAMHVRNLEFEKKDFWRRTLLTTIVMFILFLGSFLIGSKHEFVSIVPTVGFFALVGGMTASPTEAESKRNVFLYGLLLSVVIILNILNNI